MDYLLLLIASAGSRIIDEELLAALRHATAGVPCRLAEEAFEFPLPRSFLAASLDHSATNDDGLGAGDIRILEDRLRPLLRGRPIDLAIVPVHRRRKRLLLADMDSTFIAQECIDELGVAAGVGDRITAITARAMRGELDFESSLRERLKLMAGLDATLIDGLLERTRFTPGGAAVVATMRRHGAYTALISGGFSQFTGHVAARLGFDEHRANRLIIARGRLTGFAEEPVQGRSAKTAALEELTTQRGIEPCDTLAVGDGANDIDMLRKAGLGVAFRAKPAVRDAAPVRIDHGDLTALLYLQGYRREEFVAGED
jgi:phosphoserine phosphatase